MAELLKDQFFTPDSINKLGETIQQFYSDFEKERFVQLVFDDSWEDKELKERMRHFTVCLHETLPQSYRESLEILKQAAPHIPGFDSVTDAKVPKWITRL